MAEPRARSFVERSRHDRRLELAKLAAERGADASLVVGISCRLGTRQAHVDYTGGLDTAAAWRGLTSWWARGVPGLSPGGARTGNHHEERGRPAGRRTPAWRDALARALPGDEVAEEEDDDDDDDDGRARARPDFAAVLARVDLAALAALARDIYTEEQRRRTSSSSSSSSCSSPARSVDDPVPLPRVSAPSFGSRHVFYILRFSGEEEEGENDDDDDDDNVIQWIAKIPAATTPDGRWDAACAEALRSEALLLHTLRTETTVPVPRVIDADCDADNDSDGDSDNSNSNKVGAPWLLMERARGRPLRDVWFDRAGAGSAEALRGRREGILANLAAAMLQLGAYTFDRGGAPAFDRAPGTLAVIVGGAGPLRALDRHAMLRRWFDEFDDSDAGTGTATTAAVAAVHRVMGPWDDAAAAYAAWLDAYPAAGPAARGVHGLLRVLLGLVREPGAGEGEGGGGGKGGGFVLARPDLDMGDVLVGDDGTSIAAVLGWGGARAAPRSLGNEALPRWLVRDFDPTVWAWTPPPPLSPPSRGESGGDRREDPPWVLRELREYYARVVRELKTGAAARGERPGDVGRRGRRHGVDDDDDDDAGVDVTKQSLLTLSLDAAIQDPRRRTAVLRRVVEKCSRPFEELDFDYFVDALGRGYQVDPFKLRFLADNVRELVDKGFVKGAAVW